MRRQDGETVLFVGDSITDCGRNRPNLTNGSLFPNQKLKVETFHLPQAL